MSQTGIYVFHQDSSLIKVVINGESILGSKELPKIDLGWNTYHQEIIYKPDHILKKFYEDNILVKIHVFTLEGNLIRTIRDTSAVYLPLVIDKNYRLVYHHDKLTVYRYDEGKIGVCLDFKEGLPEGPFKCFHRNGKVSEEGFFKHGKKDGKWQTFCPRGKRTSLMNWKDNRLTDKFFTWSSNKSKVIDVKGCVINGWYTTYIKDRLYKRKLYRNSLLQGTYEYRLIKDRVWRDYTRGDESCLYIRPCLDIDYYLGNICNYLGY